MEEEKVEIAKKKWDPGDKGLFTEIQTAFERFCALHVRAGFFSTLILSS